MYDFNVVQLTAHSNPSARRGWWPGWGGCCAGCSAARSRSPVCPPPPGASPTSAAASPAARTWTRTRRTSTRGGSTHRKSSTMRMPVNFNPWKMLMDMDNEFALNFRDLNEDWEEIYSGYKTAHPLHRGWSRVSVNKCIKSAGICSNKWPQYANTWVDIVGVASLTVSIVNIIQWRYCGRAGWVWI